MENNAYCPMIHGGLTINTRDTNLIRTAACCLHVSAAATDNSELWHTQTLHNLRELNEQDIWHSACLTCKRSELAGHESLRTGMIKKFGRIYNQSGPSRLDLMFDSSCNLACRTCGPELSSFWRKHMQDNAMSVTLDDSRGLSQMTSALKSLDLSNLEMVVLSGGETLLGNAHWQIVELLANLVDNSEQKLTISFQTNGTQSIPTKYHSLIRRFKLVMLNISMDGTGDKFEYLRWPARWSQFTENINRLRDSAPSNVMMLIEETISIFNLYYLNETSDWVSNNYYQNREGDPVITSRHLAEGIFNINNISNEYFNRLPDNLKAMFSSTWQENPTSIQRMINEILKFDKIRGQSWNKTFPDVAEFYQRYL